MKKLFTTVLFIIAAGNIFAQCLSERKFQGYVVFSPGIMKYYKSNIGVNAELGIALPSSPFVITMKGDCWIDKISGFDSLKGRHYTIERTTGIVAPKIYYTPMAYEDVSHKWMFGTGLGLYMEEKKEMVPVFLPSAAYLIRLAGQNGTSQVAYFRTELSAVTTPRFVRPGISISMLVLM